ncbi:DUF3347 domain-containing protein [Maribellus comscasis]|uniref:DUF3347 domain-containing protein n=1 Tax=Maribellus comscasis TaxID=2681766 RepID=A0A6I6JXF9_9BACT|nr:DUF3347 domain-containing protein [Maribellus comscasis]QGY45840.1 DUF3347 domain-containing protein [Maribellus comscasis]
MKKTMIMLILALVSWGANAQHDHSNMGHSTESHSKMANKSMEQSNVEVERSKSASAIIDNYLALKDALVADNSKKAANSGKMLFEAFEEFDISAQPKSEQKELGEIIEVAREHAEHISENDGNIEHQREHFEMLSTDVKDLVIITGTDRDLYQIFCPMYNNNEGGSWLSASSEIKNPFFGSKMLKCGSVQQNITVK